MPIANSLPQHLRGLARIPERRGRVVGICVTAAACALSLAACGGPSAAQSVTSLLSAGISAQNSGDNATASKDYNAVLTMQPKNVYALFDLGDVQQYMGKDSAARSSYFHVLAINPNYEPALYNLATLEAKTDPSVARSMYLQVIRLSPKDADAHFNLGYVLISLGQTSAGQAQLSIAVRLDPHLKAREKKAH